MSSENIPNVLIIAGHDPSGGAGLQADIQAVSQIGAHASAVITCLTLQDTRNAQAVWPIDVDKIIAQLQLLTKDLKFSAIKLGLLGTPNIAIALTEFIQNYLSDVPLVIDPVLVASGGGELALDSIIHIYRKHLFPLATVVTPNAHERRALSLKSDPDEQINDLLNLGSESLLIKGGDEDTSNVINTFYQKNLAPNHLEWQRFQGEFHGSGCTLAAAIAAFLATGESLEMAVNKAQEYTHNAIKHSYQPGSGQSVPNRINA